MSNTFGNFDPNVAFGGQQEDFDSGGDYFAPMIMFLKGDPSIGAAVAKASKTKLADVESLAFHGGFFITDENVPKDANGDLVDLSKFGWLRDSFSSHESGKDITGYSRRSMEIAAITSREGWAVIGKGIFPTYDEATQHGSGNRRASGKMHIIVVIRGMEEFGPFVISLGGYSQMAFKGSGQFGASGFLPMAKNGVIATAKAAAPGNWLLRAFWIPIRASVNSAGEPLFYTAGKGDKTTKIVVPQFGIDDVSKIDLSDMFVGQENVTAFNEIADSAKDWRAEWDTAQLTEQRNVPEVNPFDSNDESLLEGAGI